MIYLFLTFIALSIFLVVKNFKSKNNIWFYFLMAGFFLAITGLALYNEYVSSYTENKLFKSISSFIWMLDYYLNLDISKAYRVMNIGTALYMYSAVCFPLPYINNNNIRRIMMIPMASIPLLMVIFYEPKIISLFYGVTSQMVFSEVNENFVRLYRGLNFVFNFAIKTYLIVSVALLMYAYKVMIPILRRKFIYMIVGIAPIHILFLILFYWFPNHNVLSTRYFMFASISAPYNQFLFSFITYFVIFSICLLIYATMRFNIFEINVRKNKVNFQRQMDTAHEGMQVFSHSIKNQFVAVKLFTEQLDNLKPGDDFEKRKKDILQEIDKICVNSIDRLGSLSRRMGMIKLQYDYLAINTVISDVIKRLEKANPRIGFIFESSSDIILYIDKKQFEKVVENIIINSIEACSKCENPVIKLLTKEQNSFAVIIVTDNGIGIRQEDLSKVFEPFYSTKPTVSNWGVGLSFCQKIIKAFGGVIEAESKVGVGTSINIYIPRGS